MQLLTEVISVNGALLRRPSHRTQGRPAWAARYQLGRLAAAQAGAYLSTLALIGVGLALGVRHATDSDHVVAVTAIAARYKRVGPAALVGVFWGLGHTLTVCAVGALIILLDLALPPRVGLALELAVGLALIVVGVLNLTGRGGFVSAAAGPPMRRLCIASWRNALSSAASVSRRYSERMNARFDARAEADASVWVRPDQSSIPRNAPSVNSTPSVSPTKTGLRTALAARGASPSSHRERRGAPMARRDD
jgi:hypothetical protein